MVIILQSLDMSLRLLKYHWYFRFILSIPFLLFNLIQFKELGIPHLLYRCQILINLIVIDHGHRGSMDKILFQNPFDGIFETRFLSPG